MAFGSPYKANGGTVVPMFGSNGTPIFITGGQLTKSVMKVDEITGPGDAGSVQWCEGNYRYDFVLRGYHAAGVEATGVTYTHSSKTLVKTGAFAPVAVGDQLYVSGGTNATPGLYTIATNADDDTVTLVTAPGTGDQTDFVLDGGPTLDDVVRGTVTLQLGTGQQATGTGIMEAISGSAMWVGGGGIIPVQLRGRYDGTPTFSRPS